MSIRYWPRGGGKTPPKGTPSQPTTADNQAYNSARANVDPKKVNAVVNKAVTDAKKARSRAQKANAKKAADAARKRRGGK